MRSEWPDTAQKEWLAVFETWSAPAAHLTACSHEETTWTHTHQAPEQQPSLLSARTDCGIDPVRRFPFLPSCTLDVTPLISRRASHSPLTRRWIGVCCRVRARRSAIERQWECCFLPVCAETCSSGAQRRSRASCVSAHRLGGKGQSARLQAIRAPST